MDREQEKFYEANPAEDIERDMDNVEEIDDMKFFLELLGHIRVAVEAGKSIPMTNKRIVDGDKILQMIEELEDNLPDAIQYGLQMYSERDRIMGNSEQDARDRIVSAELQAKAMVESAQRSSERTLADAHAEAEAILEDAQQRADFMVSEDEIISRAREEARNIRNSAAIEANEMMLKARHDALEIVSGAEAELKSALENIMRRHNELAAVNQE